MVNIVCTIVELTVNDDIVLAVLQYLNYAFCITYIIEAILKIVGHRQYYFYSKWNVFDFVILLVAIVDIIVELSLPQDSTSRFSPSVLRVVRVLRVLRVGRVLRLIKVISFLCLPSLLLSPTCISPCLLYTSPSPRDATLSRMPSSA